MTPPSRQNASTMDNGKDILELELQKAKSLLHMKKRQLKRYNKQTKVKQHVQDTLKRFKEEAELEEDLPDKSIRIIESSGSKSSDSKSVKFSSESPEVIFVTTDAQCAKRKSRANISGYRSLGHKQDKNEAKPSTSAEVLHKEKEMKPRHKPTNTSSKNRFEHVAGQYSPGAVHKLKGIHVEDFSALGRKNVYGIKKHQSVSRENIYLSKSTERNNNGIESKIDFTSCSVDGKCVGSPPSRIKETIECDTIIPSSNKVEFNTVLSSNIEDDLNGELSSHTTKSKMKKEDNTTSTYKKVTDPADPKADLKGKSHDEDEFAKEFMEDQDLFSFDIDDNMLMEKNTLSQCISSQEDEIHDDSLNEWIESQSQSLEQAECVISNTPDNVKQDTNEDNSISSGMHNNDFHKGFPMEIGPTGASDLKTGKEVHVSKADLSRSGKGHDIGTPLCTSSPLRTIVKSPIASRSQASSVLVGKDKQLPTNWCEKCGPEKNKENVTCFTPLKQCGNCKVDKENEVEDEIILERRIHKKRHKYLMGRDSRSKFENRLSSEDLFLENKASKSRVVNNCGATSSVHSNILPEIESPTHINSDSHLKDGISKSLHCVGKERDPLITADTQLYSALYDQDKVTGSVNKDFLLHKTVEVMDRLCLCGSEGKSDHICEKCKISAKCPSPEVTCSVELFNTMMDNPLDTSNRLSPNIKNRNVSEKSQDSNMIRSIENPWCSERLRYLPLKPRENIGEILTTTQGSLTVEGKDKLYIILVCEFGFSLWYQGSVGTKDNEGDAVSVRLEKQKGTQHEEWILISEKKHHIGMASEIRNIVSIGLPPEEDDMRCIVAVTRTGDDFIKLAFLQKNIHEDFLIIESSLEFSQCNQSSHLFGCSLNSWCFTLSWDTAESFTETFLVINFDVSYSRRNKKWDLQCSSHHQYPKWCTNLLSISSLHEPDLQGYALCTTKDGLKMYNVVEDIVIHHIRWELSPVFWAMAVKEFLFVLCYDDAEKETQLCAVNPLTGLFELFFSWSQEEEEEPISRKSSKNIMRRSLDAMLHEDSLVISYASGMIVHVNLLARNTM